MHMLPGTHDDDWLAVRFAPMLRWVRRFLFKTRCPVAWVVIGSAKFKFRPKLAHHTSGLLGNVVHLQSLVPFLSIR